MSEMDRSPATRAKVIALRKHTPKTIRQISDDLVIPKSTVYNIIKKYKESGATTADRLGKCGRKRKLSKREERMLVTSSRKRPRDLPNVLKNDLNLPISSSSIRRILFKSGRRARRPLTKQLLTEVMKRKCLKWANDHKDWSVDQWQKVLFTDKSHFLVQGNQSRVVRRGVGSPVRPSHINQVVKHPPKVMFWGFFSYEGTGRLHICEGIMNSAKYLHVIQSRIIPQLEEHFPDGDGVLQQDLAPCHTSKVCTKFFMDNGIEVMAWPGNSPDIAPIENLWSIVKVELGDRDYTMRNKLISNVLSVWNHNKKIKAATVNLVKSMPKQVEMVIKAKGGHIKY